MKNYLLLLILYLILLSTSCIDEKEEMHITTVKNELGEFTTYELNNNVDSIISRKDDVVNWIKKIYNNDSLYMWNYENELLESEGIIFEEEALGKWKFYKKGTLESIKEFIKVDEKQYMNQVWHFSKNGDTLKNKGNYYNITYDDNPKTNERMTIRFYLEKSFLDYFDTKMIVLYKAKFFDLITGKEEIISDKILGVNNEVLLKISFNNPGIFILDGYIIELSTLDETENILERRLYFNEKIEIKE